MGRMQRSFSEGSGERLLLLPPLAIGGLCLSLSLLLAFGCDSDPGAGDSDSMESQEETKEPDSPSVDNTREDAANYIGAVEFSADLRPNIEDASVPFVYFEEQTYYLYMCKGTQGHHVATSSDGVVFSTPKPTGIGFCGLNFVKLSNDNYRLFTTSRESTDTGETIHCKSATFSNLENLGPSHRSEEGVQFGSSGPPCNDFIGTPSVVRLSDNDSSVRVYFSCGQPSHMAGFTSNASGTEFGGGEILIEQAIDAEIHRLSDGSYRVFHTVMNPDDHPDIRPFKPQEIKTAVSADGLVWESQGTIADVDSVASSLGESITVLADPSAVLLEDGSWRIYFGNATEHTDGGGIYSFVWRP